MTLFTKAQTEKLIANCQAQIVRMDAGDAESVPEATDSNEGVLGVLRAAGTSTLGLGTNTTDASYSAASKVDLMSEFTRRLADRRLEGYGCYKESRQLWQPEGGWTWSWPE